MEKKFGRFFENEDTPQCLHQFHSELPRNQSVIPDHMLMNKDKKVKEKESGGKSVEESGKFLISRKNIAYHHQSYHKHTFKRLV